MKDPHRYKAFLGEESTFLVPGRDTAFFGGHMARYIFASHFAAGKRVLDVGCGAGYGTAHLATQARYAIGIDASQEAIDIARNSYWAQRAHFFRMDATNLGFSTGSFDLVTCFEIVEHVDNEIIDDIFLEVVRCLRPDGLALFSTPNIDVVIKAGSEIPDFHINNLNPNDLRKILRKHFRDVKLWGQRLRGNWLYRVLQSVDLIGLRHKMYSALDDPGKKKAYAFLGVDAERPHSPSDYFFSRWHVRTSGMLLAFCKK